MRHSDGVSWSPEQVVSQSFISGNYALSGMWESVRLCQSFVVCDDYLDESC